MTLALLLGLLLAPDPVPAVVRAALAEVVQGTRPCVPGDPFAAVTVDVRARRIELCAGGDVSLQTAFGAFLLFDATAGWSDELAWRRLNGWSHATLTPWRLRPGNQAAEAFAGPSGQESPARELASFAAAYVRERAMQKSTALTCRLLPQARFLHARLGTLGLLPAALRAPPRCAAFEAWADLAQLERIEVVLATPSTVTMASMFGHVFLRLVRREGAGRGPLDDPTLGFLVAGAGDVTEERFYALKGIMGVYQASLVERPFLETYRAYVVNEGRDLRRYRLNLTSLETEALLARLWSLRQAGRFDYYFFGTNCATLLVDLLQSVVKEPLQAPSALATTPAGTLEGYAFARGDGAGSALITFIPETTFSHAHEARRAADDRARVQERLEARFPGLSWADGTAADPEQRARLYRAAGVLGGTVTEGEREELLRFLRASAAIEAQLSSAANQAAELAEARARRERLHAAVVGLRGRLGAAACRALPAPLADSADEDRQVRLRGYGQLARVLTEACVQPLVDDVRRLVLLESEARADAEALPSALRDELLFPDRARTLGEQAYARGLTELIDDAHVTRISAPLRAVQQARSALGTPYPAALVADEGRARRAEEAALHARAVPRTGIDELQVGAGTARGTAGGGDWQGLLVLAGAMHDERLGDQRRFGFAAHTELVVLRSELGFARAGHGATIAHHDTRMLGYRSLRPSAPLAGRRIGGELAFDLEGRPGAVRPLQVRLGGGALVPLLASPSLADHLLLTAGPLVTFDQVQVGDRAGVGVTAGLDGRVALAQTAGAFASARAELRPVWTTRGFVQGAAARAELRLPLADAIPWPLGGPARGLSLRLQGGVQTWRAGDAAFGEGRTTVSLAIE